MNLTSRIFTNADQEVVNYDGSPVTWRVSAYVLVVTDRKLLIIKNKHEKVYDVPGGGIEIGETIEEAVAREAMEEAGAIVKVGKLVDVVEDWFYYKKGTYHQTIQLFYQAKLIGKLGKPAEGTIEFVDFIPFNNLDEYPLPVAVEKALKQLKKRNLK